MKIACIGTGTISAVHLRYLKTRKDVEIAGLCDIHPTTLERRQKEFGGRGFSDFRVMLDTVKPDAVWLCTPPQVRRDPLLACAERDIPVFCEKPVERDVRRAERLARELKRRKAHVQIGYLFRTMPITQRLRTEMADDRIYTVQSFYGCNVSLTMSLAPWFYDKALSGGGLVDQATHNFDLLRSLIGEVKEVRGLASNPVRRKHKGYTVDETIGLALRFGNGCLATHLHTWVGEGWRNEIILTGEKRVYRMNIWKNELVVDDGSHTRIFRQVGMYEAQNEIFLRMVRSGKWSENPCTYEEGLKTLKLTLACDAALAP